MSEKKVLFVTVGTTALYAEGLGEAGDDFKALGKSRERYKKGPEARKPEIEIDENMFKRVVAAHRELWDDERNTPVLSKPERTSAEMTSTYLLLMQTDQEFPGPLDPGSDRIVLLASDTHEGNFCARVNAQLMHEYLFAPRCECGADLCESRPCQAVTIKKVEGLEAKVFEGTTSRSVFEILTKCSKGFKAYCNITGGFKGTIPAITSWAISSKERCDLFSLLS